ncbi:hypothetical protein VTK73DRAFT_7763 [Phialemonium thermophilum]|uniref:LDB19 N-terminal domain-containing protein n=1 Tax=Phialemonium thermophilum TaxID=223376 RepID=A0ABR3XS78_9PEZI
MPHLVTSFFKTSTNTLENQVSSLKKKTVANSGRRRVSPARFERASRSSERVWSYASSTEDVTDASHAPPYAARMAEASPHSGSGSESHKDHHHHRISFPSLHLGRSIKESSSSSAVTLDWKLESPPIVFYGDAENSSGALVSGQLFLNINREEGLEFDSFDATLTLHVLHKKPYTVHCHECSNQVTQLKKWVFLDRPLILAKGQHAFPFSILLEGHLPATMDGPLMAVSYQFKSEAVPRASNGFLLPPVKLEKVLEVKRSLPVPELPHHSVRVFPPTNIKASVHYPQVIHPIGNNTLSLRLDGIAKHNEKANTIEYWKLKKLTWRLEETTKAMAPACEKHAPRDESVAADQEPPKKSVLRTDTKVIGEKTLFTGWKTNYGSVTDSLVEMELEYYVGRHARLSCNTKLRDGSEVTHQLMVEMVVSQELAPANKPSQSTPTGVGRILRMHFGTVLTERAGIGISWDNEAPPIYQDVPPSPPAYPGGSQPGTEICAIDEVIEPLDGVSASGAIPARPAEVLTAGVTPRTSGEGR